MFDGKLKKVGIMYTIFTDTDTDITPVVAKKYGYELISMPYSIDENEVYPYESFEEFNGHEFYESLRNGTMPKTYGISPEKYYEYFAPHFKAGRDILYVHFSSAMSGTFNAMRIAIAKLKEDFPERNFYEVDTKGITIESYNIVLEIGDLYKQGKSIQEILEWAKTEVDKFATYFYVENLDFFKRSGRVTNVTAVMGNLLGVHPIIYMDENGMMTSVDKGMGKKQTIRKIMNYVETLGDDIENHRIIIGHSDCLDKAEELGNLMTETYGNGLKIEYVIVNPTAGSHCGPNGVGICFHSIHR